MRAMLVQVHKWVNVDSMLQNCLVGSLSGPVSVPKPRPPTPKHEESTEHSAGLAVGTRVTILPSFHMSEYRGMHGRVLSFESDSTRIRPPASLEHCFRFVRRSLRSRHKSLLAELVYPVAVRRWTAPYCCGTAVREFESVEISHRDPRG